MKKVTTLILPIAGLGKRLLPLTENTPKNLIPVNGKPLLEYVLDEAVESGIKDVVLIVNPQNKTDFEQYIKESGAKFPSLTFSIRVQDTPGGNGHAIVQAYDLAKNQPFAVRFCDDVLLGNPPVLQCMVDIFNQYRAPIVLLEKVPKDQVSRFGVVGFSGKRGNGNGKTLFGGKVQQITQIVEKPKVQDAPSNMTIVGGYVLTPEVAKSLKLVADTLPTIANDALPLAVALQIELIVGRKIYGWEFPGKHLDCGTIEKLQESERFLLTFAELPDYNPVHARKRQKAVRA